MHPWYKKGHGSIGRRLFASTLPSECVQHPVCGIIHQPVGGERTRNLSLWERGLRGWQTVNSLEPGSQYWMVSLSLAGTDRGQRHNPSQDSEPG